MSPQATIAAAFPILYFIMERLPVSQRVDVFLRIIQESEGRIMGSRLQPLSLIPLVIPRV
jgi:hypothetical protein